MLRALIFWSPVLALLALGASSLAGLIEAVTALAFMLLVLVFLQIHHIGDLRERVRGLERRWPSSEG